MVRFSSNFYAGCVTSKNTTSPLLAALRENEEETQTRLKKLADEDPISLQDVEVTCTEFLKMVETDDVDAVQGVCERAYCGELIQGVVRKGFHLALKNASVDMLKLFMKYDVPLYHHLLNPAIITLCHTVTPDNFGKYRVCVEFLVSEGKVDINAKVGYISLLYPYTHIYVYVCICVYMFHIIILNT
eukprot:GHVR01142528.1.p1 GENE.GHVR01142528.1~~GHVR01142528.1.p1  ORF type:complete len:187 (-),score=31.59 GHVR01142528.1:118-678(-)